MHFIYFIDKGGWVLVVGGVGGGGGGVQAYTFESVMVDIHNDLITTLQNIHSFCVPLDLC